MKTAAERQCRRLLEQLSRYIDGDLTAVERKAVAAHLRRCPCCRTMADSLKHTVELCHEAGAARLPADVTRRARARIASLLASDRSGRSRT
ncbi:MAG TPA: zf-HC2 domain-containing protein [Vicinamibacterales bacterium]|nr:zf-HC2 domain-containing protein [Vicinamibacterales bacterium]HPW22214.1 zf-HC2 domain-containing protein [Vicinamibacterales bacterium]